MAPTNPDGDARTLATIALAERERLVLKPAAAYGGRGVVLGWKTDPEAWQEALDVRKGRQETLERNPALLKWDEAWESVCRKVNRVTGIGSVSSSGGNVASTCAGWI